MYGGQKITTDINIAVTTGRKLSIKNIGFFMRLISSHRILKYAEKVGLFRPAKMLFVLR